MKKSEKIWLITASFLVLAGLLLFSVAMTVNGWDFHKLSTVKYDTTIHEIHDDFSAVSVNTDTADLNFLLSEDGKCRVECFESENEKYSVSAVNDKLCINVTDEFDFPKHIQISFHTPKITVFLPKEQYTSLFVKESTGDITVKNVSFKDVNLTVSTGNINIENVKCENLVSDGNTGDLYLHKVVASQSIDVERSTGNIYFEKCDAGEISVKTSTGDVSGVLLTGKIFDVKTSTGDIDVPKSATGGNCKIKTSTGDVKITIEETSVK